MQERKPVAPAFEHVLDHLPDDLGLISQEEIDVRFFLAPLAYNIFYLIIPTNPNFNRFMRRKTIEREFARNRGLELQEWPEIRTATAHLIHRLALRGLLIDANLEELDGQRPIARHRKFKFKTGIGNYLRTQEEYAVIGNLAGVREDESSSLEELSKVFQRDD